MLGLLTARAVYLPVAYSRMAFTDSITTEGWKTLPLGLLYDLEYMRSCTGRLGLRILESCVPSECKVQPTLVLPNAQALALFMNDSKLKLTAQELHITIADPPLTYLGEQDIISAFALDRCIQFSVLIQNAAAGSFASSRWEGCLTTPLASTCALRPMQVTTGVIMWRR